MVTAAVRPRPEAGEVEGVPPEPAGDGRAVFQRVDVPAEPSAPSSSSQSQPKVPEAAHAQTPGETRSERSPCGSDEEFYHGADEDCGARVLASPIKPTQAMIDDHEVHHQPFRSWCCFCVRGRAVSVGHSHHIKNDDEQIPTLVVDYGFLGGAPILVVKCRHTKVLWSSTVPNKGLEPSLHGARQLLKAIEWTGYKRLMSKCDQENSTLAVLNWVKAQFAGEILPELVPIGGHENRTVRPSVLLG